MRKCELIGGPCDGRVIEIPDGPMPIGLGDQSVVDSVVGKATYTRKPGRTEGGNERFVFDGPEVGSNG